MIFFKKICIGVLIFSFLGLHFPNITLAASHYLAQGAIVTKHTPEMLATPEEKIPVEEVAVEKRSRTWLWVLGGALLVGIIAAAGGGGGGDGGGDNTGDVTVNW